MATACNNDASIPCCSGSNKSRQNPTEQYKKRFPQESQDQDDFSQTDPTPAESISGPDFVYINEKPVDDVSLTFFYQPRTLTLLCIVIIVLVQIAFQR